MEELELFETDISGSVEEALVKTAGKTQRWSLVTLNPLVKLDAVRLSHHLYRQHRPGHSRNLRH